MSGTKQMAPLIVDDDSEQECVNESVSTKSVLSFDRSTMAACEDKLLNTMTTEQILMFAVYRGERDKNPTISEGVGRILQRINGERTFDGPSRGRGHGFRGRGRGYHPIERSGRFEQDQQGQQMEQVQQMEQGQEFNGSNKMRGTRRFRYDNRNRNESEQQESGSVTITSGEAIAAEFSSKRGRRQNRNHTSTA